MIDDEEKAKFEKVYNDYKKSYDVVSVAMKKESEEKLMLIDHLTNEQRQAVRDIAGVAQGMLDEYKAFSHPTMEQVISLDDKLTMLRHEFVLSTNL